MSLHPQDADALVAAVAAAKEAGGKVRARARTALGAEARRCHWWLRLTASCWPLLSRITSPVLRSTPIGPFFVIHSPPCLLCSRGGGLRVLVPPPSSRGPPHPALPFFFFRPFFKKNSTPLDNLTQNLKGSKQLSLHHIPAPTTCHEFSYPLFFYKKQRAL